MVDFVPKVKLEVAIETARVEEVVDAIIEAAQTGKLGDGKIFVYDLNQAIRIRTGETGADVGHRAAGLDAHRRDDAVPVRVDLPRLDRS